MFNKSVCLLSLCFCCSLVLFAQQRTSEELFKDQYVTPLSDSISACFSRNATLAGLKFADSLINVSFQNNQCKYLFEVGYAWKFYLLMGSDDIENRYLTSQEGLERLENCKDFISVEDAEYWEETWRLFTLSYHYARKDWGALRTESQRLLYVFGNKNTDGTNYSLMTVYAYLLVMHQQEGNYGLALDFLRQASEKYQLSPSAQVASPTQSGLFTKWEADILAHQPNKKHEAPKLYEKAEAIYRNSGQIEKNRAVNERMATTLFSHGQLVLKNGDTSKALALFREALTVYGSNHERVEEAHRHLAEVYLQTKDYDQSLFHLKLAESTNNYARPHYRIAETYGIWGNWYQQQGQFAEALEMYQKALMNFSQNFTDGDLCKNPEELDQVFAKKEMLEVLRSKTEALRTLAGDDQKLLACSQATNELAIRVLDQLKTNNETEYNRARTITDNYTVFEEGIAIANQRGDYALAFELAEKSQSNLLLSAVLQTQLQEGLIPEDLMEKGQQLKIDLRELESKVEAADRAAEQDVESKQKASATRLALAEFNQQLRQEYSRYFQLTQAGESDDYTAVAEELPVDQPLLSFYLGEQISYGFLLRPGQEPFVYNIGLNATDLQDSVTHFLRSIYVHKADSLGGGDQKLKAFWTEEQSNRVYARLGYYLKEQLLSEALAEIPTEEGQRLLIVPHGVLTYLPFSALLRQSVPPEDIGFYGNDGYDYLARNYQISYAYSATLHRLMKDAKVPVKQKGVLVFHDLEFDEHTQSILDAFGQQEDEAGYVEVLNQSSTLETLRERGADYQAIHLSVHGIVNTERPSTSHFRLRAPYGTQEDSLLQLSGLYGYELPVELVFMAACNAGVGQLNKGEGVLSLARGFAYAGAKSLVTTLWSVRSGATNNLMTDFYGSLRSGQLKDEALYVAKKKMIASQQTNHPYNWAGFVFIGDPAPLSGSGCDWWPWWLLGIVGLVVLGLWWQRGKAAA